MASNRKRSKPIKLHPVELSKTDNCATYVQKRLGMFKYGKDAVMAYWFMYDDRFEVVNERPKKGDILLWYDPNDHETIATGIDATGHIYSVSKITSGHVEICEGDKYCSGVYLNGAAGWPQLRLRIMDDISRPDYVLRLKKK